MIRVILFPMKTNTELLQELVDSAKDTLFKFSVNERWAVRQMIKDPSWEAKANEVREMIKAQTEQVEFLEELLKEEQSKA